MISNSKLSKRIKWWGSELPELISLIAVNLAKHDFHAAAWDVDQRAYTFYKLCNNYRIKCSLNSNGIDFINTGYVIQAPRNAIEHLLDSQEAVSSFAYYEYLHEKKISHYAEKKRYVSLLGMHTAVALKQLDILPFDPSYYYLNSLNDNSALEFKKWTIYFETLKPYFIDYFTNLQLVMEFRRGNLSPRHEFLSKFSEPALFSLSCTPTNDFDS